MANADTIIKIAIEAENRVLQTFKAIEETAKRTADYIQSQYTEAGTKASAVFERTIGQSAKNAQLQAEKIYQTLKDLPAQVQGQVSTAYKTAMDQAVTIVNAGQVKISELMKNSVSTVRGQIEKRIVEPYQLATERIKGLVNNLTESIKQTQARIVEIMKFAAANPGAAIEKAIIEPYRKAFGQVKELVTDQVNDIKDRLKTATPGGLAKQSERIGERGIVGLAQSAGGTFRQATRAAMVGERAGLDTKVLGQAIESMKSLEKLGVPVITQQKLLQKSLGVTEEQFKAVGKAAKVFGSGGGGMMGGGRGGIPFGALAMGLGAVGLAIAGIKMAFGAAFQAGQRFYQGLVGANEQLNQQILGSAANLAATSRVFKEGLEVIDPTEKIQQLQGPLRNALKQIAQDSIALVGVTSQELTSVFAILNSQAAQLTRQSKEFASAIDSAGKLTIDFAAALGTIGMPLAYAGQEIRSILTGTIDMNSTLAKQLGITNDMVKSWKAQGVLVDKLRDRLEPFVKGNALAAQSISGVSSNIKDVIEIIQRDLGEPLIEPIVDGLNWVFNKLSDNRELIQELLRPFITTIIEAGKATTGLMVPAIEKIGQAFVAIQPLALATFQGIAAAAVTVVNGISAIVYGISEVVQRIGQIYNFIIRITKAINPFARDADAALASGANSISVLTKEQSNLEKKYADIAEKKRQGIELTKEEIETERQLKSMASESVNAIDAQIEMLKKMVPATEEQRGEIGKQIKSLEQLKRAYEVGGTVAGVEAQIDALKERKKSGKENNEQIDSEIERLEELKKSYIASGKAIGMSQDFNLTGMPIEKLGNDFEQLTKRVNTARDQMKAMMSDQGGGDPNQFQQQIDVLISASQQAFESGVMSREQLAENLKMIIDSDKITVESRQKASQLLIQMAEKEKQTRLDLIDDEIRNEEIARQKGASSGVESEKKLTALKQEQLTIQLEQVKAQIEQEQQLRENNVKEQIANIDQKLVAARAAVVAARTAKNPNEEKIAEERVKALLDEKMAAQASLNIQSTRGKELVKQEAEIQDQLTNTVIEGNRKVQDAIESKAQQEVEVIRNKQKEIQVTVQEGGKSQLDAIKETTNLQQDQIQIQLDAIAEQIKEEQKLRQGNDPTSREKELLSRQKSLQLELRQVVIDGERQLRQQQITEIQRTSDKVLDAVNLAATERMLAIQEQVNKDPLAMREAERAELELDIQRDKLAAEYEQEKANLEKIKALPLPRDPEERARAEDEIRGAIQRTTDLALQMAQMEERAQKAAIERVQDAHRKALEARLNQIEAERQALEAQVQAYDGIINQMRRQLELIDRQISATEKFNDLTQSYYAEAAKFADDEEQARQIQQEAALVRIRQLNEQQEIERIKLELTLEQNKALLEQELIQARIAQLQAKADEAQAIADYKMAAADPTTTPEKLEAMQLQITAKQAQGMAASFGVAMAQQSLDNFDKDANIQRTMLRQQQERDMFGARSQYAQATLTEADDRALGREALGRARQGASSNFLNEMRQGIDENVGEFGQLSEQLRNLQGDMGGLSGVIQSIPGVSSMPIVESMRRRPEETATRPPSVDTAPSSEERQGRESGGQTNEESNQNADKIINFNPVFNNTFGGSGKPDANAVKDFERGTLSVLKKVLDLV